MEQRLQNRLRAVTKMMIISHCKIRGTGLGAHKKLKWLGKKIRIGPRRNMLPPGRVKQQIRLLRGEGEDVRTYSWALCAFSTRLNS